MAFGCDGLKGCTATHESFGSRHHLVHLCATCWLLIHCVWNEVAGLTLFGILAHGVRGIACKSPDGLASQGD